MTEKEREIHAQQHKDRVDLNEQQAKEWGKFLKQKDNYTQKYGAAYADILLKKEKEALEAEFGQDHQDLNESHGQQWLAHHENNSEDKPYTLPHYLKGPEPLKEQGENDIGKDEKNSKSETIQQYRDQARETLFTNPFKQIDHEQTLTAHSQTKDIDQSQSYMKGMLSAQIEDPKTEKAPVSMFARFSQGLSYTRAAEKTDQHPKREVDKERD